MTIVIKFIPHSKQRYPTCGDWVWKDDTLYIYASKLNNKYYSFLIAYHELFEAIFCKKNKLSQKAVDEFDIQFEKDRKEGLYSEDDEPGDQPNAPYGLGHQLATVLERIACLGLGLNWKKYDKEVARLYK